MIPTKLVSSKECVERFYTDTGSQNFINSDDVKVWIVEVFGLIQYPLQYITKVVGYKQDSTYDFTNYEVPLPCDFVSFIPGGIAVNGNSVRYVSGSFGTLTQDSNQEDCCGLSAYSNTHPDIFTDNFGNQFSPQFSLAPNSVKKYQDITFSIKGDNILFNIKEGKVCLAYTAFPIDNEGYLMIPDTAKYKRAVTDYLIWKHDYIQWRSGQLPGEVYKESKDNKTYSIASAAGEIKMPSDYQLDSMKNTLIRLIPKFSSKNNFYKDFGIQEQRRLG